MRARRSPSPVVAAFIFVSALPTLPSLAISTAYQGRRTVDASIDPFALTLTAPELSAQVGDAL
jgi:hypothetical protein